MNSICQLFNPRSIAVIDSTFDGYSAGKRMIDNCIASGYEGRIHAVNVSKKKNDRDDIYESCLCIKGKVDIGVVFSSEKDFEQSFKDCVDKGLSYIFVWPQNNIESSVVRDYTVYAKQYGSRVVGPGDIGLYSTGSRLQLCLSPGKILNGGVSVITHQAYTGKTIAEVFSSEGLGISSAIALGDKIDVDEVDCLKYYKDDDSTQVICMHLNDFNYGDELWKQLEDTAKNKSVVVMCSDLTLKTTTGCSKKDNSTLFKELLQQCGAYVTESFNEALDWCRMLTVTDTMWTKENKMF